LKKIEEEYGKGGAHLGDGSRDPTEEVLEEMRQSDPPVYYLWGRPKGD